MPEYVQLNTLHQAICKMCAIRFDVHTVNQQEVVTYMSPVEILAAVIKFLIGKNSPLLLNHSLLMVLIFGGS